MTCSYMNMTKHKGQQIIWTQITNIHASIHPPTHINILYINIYCMYSINTNSLSIPL